MSKARANYKDGKRFFNFQNRVDRMHKQIDKRSKRGDNDTNAMSKHYKENNETGRVWSF